VPDNSAKVSYWHIAPFLRAGRHGYRRLFLVACLAGLDAFSFAGKAPRDRMIGSKTKFSRSPPICSVVLPP